MAAYSLREDRERAIQALAEEYSTIKLLLIDDDGRGRSIGVSNRQGSVNICERWSPKWSPTLQHHPHHANMRRDGKARHC